MSKHNMLAATAVFLFWASSVAAATPTLSGNYVYTGIGVCAADESSIAFDSGILTFAAKAKVTFKASHTGGSYPGNGNLFTQSVENGKGTYSNTATTLTINGSGQAPLVYQATYGSVNGAGVAGYVSLVGINDGGSCEDEVTLSLQ